MIINIFRSVSLSLRTFTSIGRTSPKESAIDKPVWGGAWTPLVSGSFKYYGNGSTGYIMQSSAGSAYWWIVRNGKTIIEGPSGSLSSAAFESDSMAKELFL